MADEKRKAENGGIRAARRVNQQRLAEALNLSVSTVSRCFTNHSGINPQTRAKVFRMAEELGYQYLDNRTRPAAPREKSNTIGVLVCARSEEWGGYGYEEPGSQLLGGVSELAQINAHKLDLHFLDPHKQESEFSEADLPEVKDWDGALLIYPFSKASLNSITDRMPCVSLVEQFGKLDVDCVDVDHYRGISEIVDRLMEMGHEEIGFVCRQWVPQAFWTIRRYGAMLEKHMVLRRDFDPKNFLKYWAAKPNGREKFIESVLKRLDAGVTALVCASDRDAFDLIADLKKAGLKVPRDVSVTGFDGIDTPRGMSKLATMRIPFWDIGRTALRRLEKVIERPNEPVAHTFLGCTFEPGETIATPRNHALKIRR